MQERFEAAAATWDENPVRVAMISAVAAAVGDAVPLSPALTALDFGCGTGLLTVALAPYVGRIVGVDTSPAMLEKLGEKIAALALVNVSTLAVDLTADPPPPALRADLIVSAMALHHIADIPALLRTLAGLLAPGGYFALADLDSEDGSFHPDPTGVYHRGLDRAWLMDALTALGCTDVRATTAYVMVRAGRQYPIFLVSGRR